mmetsp:Transcript_12783/g.53754  ORF Transcript_12783/g.53754 Transcript_12783/m.53754 type:complete len:219 (+) Transcript_12783:1345-2001(+)
MASSRSLPSCRRRCRRAGDRCMPRRRRALRWRHLLRLRRELRPPLWRRRTRNIPRRARAAAAGAATASGAVASATFNRARLCWHPSPERPSRRQQRHSSPHRSSCPQTAARTGRRQLSRTCIVRHKCHRRGCRPPLPARPLLRRTRSSQPTAAAALRASRAAHPRMEVAVALAVAVVAVLAPAPAPARRPRRCQHPCPCCRHHHAGVRERARRPPRRR